MAMDSCRNSAFEKLKEENIRITPLKHYDEKAENILTTDASPYGLGATLWQLENNERRPVAFASRYLGDSDYYAQNELELLGVVWGVEHFKHYQIGKHFKIETDHSSFVNVFNRDRNNKDYSPRLIRWRHRMLLYDFGIVHVPGKEMGKTDYLSRTPNAIEPEDKNLVEETTICLINFLNETKNKTLTKAVLDALSKPFEPQIRKARSETCESSERLLIARVKEQLKTA